MLDFQVFWGDRTEGLGLHSGRPGRPKNTAREAGNVLLHERGRTPRHRDNQRVGVGTPVCCGIRKTPPLPPLPPLAPVFSSGGGKPM